MSKQSKAILVFTIYLFTVAIGSLTIVHSKWNEYQIFSGVSFISLTFFLLMSKNNAAFCYQAIKTYPTLSLKLGIYLTLMLMPIYLTQKNGVTATFYAINFSIVMAFLGSINTKKFGNAVFYLVIYFVLLTYHKFELFHIIAFIGPVGAYYMLKISKIIAEKMNGNTSKIMCLRYYVLSIGTLFMLPFLDFNSQLFTFSEVGKILEISFFLNIIPIYCAQYVVLLMSNNFIAKGAVLLPLVTSLIGAISFGVKPDKLEFLVAVIIAFPMIFILVRFLILVRHLRTKNSVN